MLKNTKFAFLLWAPGFMNTGLRALRKQVGVNFAAGSQVLDDGIWIRHQAANGQIMKALNFCTAKKA